MEAHGSCIFTQKNLQILTKTSNTIFSSRDLQFKQNELVFINFVPCIVSKNIKKFSQIYMVYIITIYRLKISMATFWIHKIWLCFITQRIAKYLGASFLGFGSFWKFNYVYVHSCITTSFMSFMKYYDNMSCCSKKQPTRHLHSCNFQNTRP